MVNANRLRFVLNPYFVATFRRLRTPGDTIREGPARGLLHILPLRSINIKLQKILFSYLATIFFPSRNPFSCGFKMT
jgi:hypothetical protein